MTSILFLVGANCQANYLLIMSSYIFDGTEEVLISDGSYIIPSTVQLIFFDMICCRFILRKH